MQINHCDICNKDWCYRGKGRAIRCGKCKSPYWDRDPVIEAAFIAGATVLAVTRDVPNMQALRDISAGKKVSFVDDAVEVEHEIPLCLKQNYNEIDGETYECHRDKGHKGVCDKGRTL